MKFARLLISRMMRVGKFRKRRNRFVSSASYWEKRYSAKGNSGAGSYGRLAAFKAQVLNQFVKEEHIELVFDFGCGDGHQLSLACYPRYVGFDVSQESLRLCKRRFRNDSAKSFRHVTGLGNDTAELVISLDVIYHLVEDDVYDKYMWDIFNASEKFVVIYSSNFEQTSESGSHVRHRLFSTWIEDNVPEFQLFRKLLNPYPYDADNPDETSLADFYFYAKTS